MVRTYNPKDVDLIIGGAKIDGYADGTFIEVVRNSNAFETTAGADGQIARAKTNDNSADITVTLLQTSNSNATLNIIAENDEQTGKGVVPIVIKERETGNKIQGGSGWCKKRPDVTYAKEISDRVWVFTIANSRTEMTGNTPV